MYALRGRDGVKPKACIYCFYEIILLFKSIQDESGCLKIIKFECTCFMDGLLTNSHQLKMSPKIFEPQLQALANQILSDVRSYTDVLHYLFVNILQY